MKNELKKKAKGMTIASWSAVTLLSIAAGVGLLSCGHNKAELKHANPTEYCNYRCGAAPSEFGGGWTIKPSGNFPIPPIGGGGMPTFPGDEPILTDGPLYHGPNLANYHEQPVFVKEYFKNLRNNFPTNDDDNNCGYVGAAMLLSYYDTCWNSAFVPDVFNDGVAELDAIDDQIYESPGVKDYNEQVWINNYAQGPKDEPVLAEGASEAEKEAYEQEKKDYENWTYGAYSLYIERMTRPVVRDSYIIPHLYKIAHDLGIIEFRNENTTGNYDWHKIMPLIDLVDLGRVLNVYFAENGLSNGVGYRTRSFYELEDYASESEKRNALRQEMIERLKKGQPVLVSGPLRNQGDSANQKGSSHIALAYEYDEANDRIYGHIGWKGPVKTRVNFDSSFFEFDKYAFININDTLRVTENNYRYRVGDTYLESFDLPSHIHSYDKAIDYGFILKHALQCTCGDVHLERHTFGIVCTKCGYRK